MQGTILWKGVSTETVLPVPHSPSVFLPRLIILHLTLAYFTLPCLISFNPFLHYTYPLSMFIRNQQGIYTYLSNRVDLLVRECVKQYYDCWLVCDDRGCARRTMQQSAAGVYQSSSHNPFFPQFSLLLFCSFLFFTSYYLPSFLLQSFSSSLLSSAGLLARCTYLIFDNYGN